MVRSVEEAECFFTPKRLYQLWGPPRFMFDGCRQQSGRFVKLTTELHLVPRFRMFGAIPPLPRMRALCSQEQLYLYETRKMEKITQNVSQSSRSRYSPLDHAKYMELNDNDGRQSWAGLVMYAVLKLLPPKYLKRVLIRS